MSSNSSVIVENIFIFVFSLVLSVLSRILTVPGSCLVNQVHVKFFSFQSPLQSL